MSSITLRDIRKSYANGPRVLHGVDLDIGDGEFVVIVGPSGCGKSTLLRLIAGLERCEDGEIIIDGRRANALAPQDRNIAMIFQNYALYPHMSVLENIAFGLELRKVPRKTREARAREVAETLQLTPYLDRKPGALSGGQRQRVAMGRAMARDTSTFLMDEPLSNLDNALRNAMRTEIKTIHQQLGATIVFVTHDQTEALSLADRIAVMKDGHLQQFDTPAAIYDHPVNRFVASFLGTPKMNFVTSDTITGWTGRRGVELGLRPDTLRLHREKPGATSIEARLTLTEMTGSEVVLHCQTQSGVMSAIAHRGQELPAPGDRIWLEYDAAAAHLFDMQTGARV